MPAALIDGERLLGHLDRLAELKARGRTGAPINVEIDLSNRCSLGCEWCHFAYTHVRGPLKGTAKPAGAIPGGDLMDTELCLRMLAEFADAGVRSVTWTGGGEPTLHPDFDQIIDACPLPQGLYTHGGHISQERAELLKRRMTFVYVSLDAVDRESYKIHKGVDRFDKACEGIVRLAEAEGDATVGVGMLVGPNTHPLEIADAPDFVRSLGADYVQFRPIISFDVDEAGVPTESREWVDRAVYEMETLADRDYVEVDLARFIAYRDWTGHGYPECDWSMLQTCVTPDGSVWACVNRREFAGSRLGSLAEEPFSAIWQRHRRTIVDGDCRVMCRGHLSNLATRRILANRPHGMFV